MLRFARGGRALRLLGLGAVAATAAAAGCGLFVDFEDGGSTSISSAAAQSTASSGGGGGAGGHAGAAAGGMAGAGGGSPACALPAAWTELPVFHWADEEVVAMVPIDADGVAVATRRHRPRSPILARETVVHVLYQGEMPKTHLIAYDAGDALASSSVALAYVPKGLIVAATVASGELYLPVTEAARGPGLMAYSVDPSKWSEATVLATCEGANHLESVDVVGNEDTVSLAANFYAATGDVTTISCGSCGDLPAFETKDILLWPVVTSEACPVIIGSDAAEDAAPRLAIDAKSNLLMAGNFTNDTNIAGATIDWAGGEITNDVDTFVVSIPPESPTTPVAAWGTPVARVVSHTALGTLAIAAVEKGVLVGGGLFGPVAPPEAPVFTPFPGNQRRALLTRVGPNGAVGALQEISVGPGMIRNIEVLGGCALVTGLADTAAMGWLQNGAADRPLFVGAIDVASLNPVTGVAFRNGSNAGGFEAGLVRRTRKGAILAATYVGMPEVAGEQLPVSDPLGTFIVELAFQ